NKNPSLTFRVGTFIPAARLSCTTIFLIYLWVLTACADAGEVRAGLSSQVTYLGGSVTLQIAVENAENHDPPQIPAIDGLEIVALPPSHSSRTSIINGRRSSSSTVIYQYELVPVETGEYQIPEISIQVDGRIVKTDALEFRAENSDAGDRLSAEVKFQKPVVFVGESTILELHVIVKPYSDTRYDITLSANDMWSLMNIDRSEWGVFEDSVHELRSNGERPASSEVFLVDEDGIKRTFYDYAIKTTYYPQRPEEVSFDNIRIVLRYPKSLDVSNVSFFSPSLVVSDVQPLVITASSDQLQVLPLPDRGKPKDFRGAIGNYSFKTIASPSEVEVGQPITLRMLVQGNGPMDLVQAPPLAQILQLTAGFVVPDEALAGIVQDDKKQFTTSIQPRNEKLTEIPPIPFSYFDPKIQAYVTTHSEPIAIRVNPAQKLDLDIVKGPQSQSDERTETQAAELGSPPADSGSDTWQLLGTSKDLVPLPARGRSMFWLGILLGPVICLIVVAGRVLSPFLSLAWQSRNTLKTERKRLQRSEKPAEALEAFHNCICLSRGVQRIPQDFRQAIQLLQSLGESEAGKKMDELTRELTRMQYGGGDSSVSQAWRAQAMSLCDQLLTKLERSK
ncbi:MAG: BatD family protein, partial [Planctomycetales bacterium]|nr:BatD family protein [Planctomycetales bacterium]